MFAVLLFAAATWTVDGTYDALEGCAVRAAKDYAEAVAEPIDLVADAAIGACRIQEQAFVSTVFATFPTNRAGDDAAQRTLDARLARLKRHLMAVAINARIAKGGS